MNWVIFVPIIYLILVMKCVERISFIFEEKKEGSAFFGTRDMIAMKLKIEEVISITGVDYINWGEKI